MSSVAGNVYRKTRSTGRPGAWRRARVRRSSPLPSLFRLLVPPCCPTTRPRHRTRSVSVVPASRWVPISSCSKSRRWRSTPCLQILVADRCIEVNPDGLVVAVEIEHHRTRRRVRIHIPILDVGPLRGCRPAGRERRVGSGIASSVSGGSGSSGPPHPSKPMKTATAAPRKIRRIKASLRVTLQNTIVSDREGAVDRITPGLCLRAPEFRASTRTLPGVVRRKPAAPHTHRESGQPSRVPVHGARARPGAHPHLRAPKDP